MPIIYDGSIRSAGTHNDGFNVAWHNAKANTQDSCIHEAEVTPKETEEMAHQVGRAAGGKLSIGV